MQRISIGFDEFLSSMPSFIHYMNVGSNLINIQSQSQFMLSVAVMKHNFLLYEKRRWVWGGIFVTTFVYNWAMRNSNIRLHLSFGKYLRDIKVLEKYFLSCKTTENKRTIVQLLCPSTPLNHYNINKSSFITWSNLYIESEDIVKMHCPKNSWKYMNFVVGDGRLA